MEILIPILIVAISCGLAGSNITYQYITSFLLKNNIDVDDKDNIYITVNDNEKVSLNKLIEVYNKNSKGAAKP